MFKKLIQFTKDIFECENINTKCLVKKCNRLAINEIGLCIYHDNLFRNLIKAEINRTNKCYYVLCPKDKSFDTNFCEYHLKHLNDIERLKIENKLCSIPNCVNKIYLKHLCKKHYLKNK